MHIVLHMMILPRRRFVSELVSHESRRVVHVTLVAPFDRLVRCQFAEMASFHLLIFAQLVRLNRLLVLLLSNDIPAGTFELVRLLHKLL